MIVAGQIRAESFYDDTLKIFEGCSDLNKYIRKPYVYPKTNAYMDHRVTVLYNEGKNCQAVIPVRGSNKVSAKLFTYASRPMLETK